MWDFIMFVFMLFLTLAIYGFMGYTYYLIGRKFGVGTLGGYMVPFYNLYLLNQCAGLPTVYLLIILIPFVGPAVYGVMLYGELARRLGKDYWLYGIGTVLIGIPIFILAFGSSMPVGAVAATPSYSNHSQSHLEYYGSTAFLKGIEGLYQGSVIPIPYEGIVVGRDPSMANIILTDGSVSKAHVRFILQQNNAVIIEDLGSTNGTFIAYPHEPHKWYPVQGYLEVTGQMNVSIRVGTGDDTFQVLTNANGV